MAYGGTLQKDNKKKLLQSTLRDRKVVISQWRPPEPSPQTKKVISLAGPGPKDVVTVYQAAPSSFLAPVAARGVVAAPYAAALAGGALIGNELVKTPQGKKVVNYLGDQIVKTKTGRNIAERVGRTTDFVKHPIAGMSDVLKKAASTTSNVVRGARLMNPGVGSARSILKKLKFNRALGAGNPSVL